MSLVLLCVERLVLSRMYVRVTTTRNVQDNTCSALETAKCIYMYVYSSNRHNEGRRCVLEHALASGAGRVVAIIRAQSGLCVVGTKRQPSSSVINLKCGPHVAQLMRFGCPH